MKRHESNCIYFIENLTVFTWLLSVLPVLLSSWQEKKVYYVDGSRIGISIARIMSTLLKARIEVFQFKMVDIRDEQGDLLSLKVLFSDLGNLQEDILKRPSFGKTVEMIGKNNRIRTFLWKQIILDMDVGKRGNYRALILVHYALWKVRRNGDGGARVIFFMNRRRWRDEISRYAACYGVQIVWFGGMQVSGKTILSLLLGPVSIQMIKTIKNYVVNEMIVNGFRRLKYVKRKDSFRFDNHYFFTKTKQRIAVEYYGHLNLDKPELYSDLFFWQQSSLRGEDILVTFNITQDPLDDKKISQMKRYNIEPLVLNHKASVVSSFPAFYHWPCILRRKRMLDIPNFPEKKWLQRQIEEYRVSYDYWKDLFQRNNIKVYISWFKYDASHCVIADALENLGGVTAIYQRSFEEFASPIRTIDSDIVFAFSSNDIDVQQKAKSIIPYHVVVGYCGDHRFTLLRKPAQDIRRKLKKNGAKYILAFFDENSADDSRWRHGHDSIRLDYSFLLEKVLSEPWLGLIIKPKLAHSLRKRMGPVVDLLDRAEGTGRCFVFEEGKWRGSSPPPAAALASDIAVHGNLSAATAGVEAALAGVPTLLVDREGWLLSPLYRLGKGKVVFNDWQSLWKTCREHWAIPGGISGFGDWSSIFDELDPFRDGRAAERIGTYLKWLLDGFKAGLGRDTILADAADRYTKLWGKDKITEVKGDSSSQSSKTDRELDVSITGSIL